MTAAPLPSQPLRLVSIVGARPQFVKLGPVCRAIARHNRHGGRPIESLIVHTGQHYDENMSDVFFKEHEIPAVTRNLGVGSGAHGWQTARMLETLEAALLELHPDVVLTYGDTNSTLAATLAATKLHHRTVHLEAGLRSFDRCMPEEINRIAADHLSDLLLAPTTTAMGNLAAEGLANRAVQTGDVMVDALQFALARPRSAVSSVERLGLEPREYIVATVHRAENTEPEVFAKLLEALEEVANEFGPVVFPAHPRTLLLLESSHRRHVARTALRVIPPLGHLDMLDLVAAARVVLTDSGGLQKEAFCLGRPCVTLRDRTEWLETLDDGWNVIAGTDVAKILAAVRAAQGRATGSEDPKLAVAAARVFGNGAAAEQVVRAIINFMAVREA